MYRIEKLGIDVYQAAKMRIRHILQIYDTVAVCFSGGKDSTVVLCRLEEIYKEDQIEGKINVVFRDEELIPDDVIDFVQEKQRSGKYNFFYFCVPLKSNKFVLGDECQYVQWDPTRRWVRPMPDDSIRLEDGDSRVFDQYTADSFICERFKGKVALLTGIRAQESLLRYRACVNKINENYINATEDKRISLCKPIYDWTENDVFVYFFKSGNRYCDIYDIQTVNGDQLRVSTPLHSEAAKKFHKLKTLYPVFFQQIVDVFPEMLLQERYWREYAGYTNDNFPYEHSFEGIRQFINCEIKDEHSRMMAMKCVNMSESIRKRKMAQGKGLDNYGGYPLYYVLKLIKAGSYKRGQFLPQQGKPRRLDIEFENGNKDSKN